jgi:3-oxoacyl-[acyl-carrier-protein] synthase-3
MRYNRVHIASLGYVLPNIEVRTSELEAQVAGLYKKMGIKPGWLQAVTGIRARRFWPREYKPSDVATRAAQSAFSQTHVQPGQIETIVSTSVCKDYIEPSVAALVHGKLGLSPNCSNFDVGNACLGFLTGMMVVADQIELGRIQAGMIVAGESSRLPTEATVERLQKPTAGMRDFRDNLATLTLGSAGVAMILCSEKIARANHRFLGGVSQAATQWSHLCVGTPTKMTTDPTTLLSEGVSLAKRTWTLANQEFGFQPDEVSEYALHQVGQANHDAVVQALKIPPNKALRLYIDNGNVGACGVPLTLAKLVEQKRVQDGNRVALMGIGSGINVMMMGVEW